MYVLVQRFKMNHSQEFDAENEFLQTWPLWTLQQRSHLCREITARLYKASDGTYVSQTSWPSKEIYEKNINEISNLSATQMLFTFSQLIQTQTESWNLLNEIGEDKTFFSRPMDLEIMINLKGWKPAGTVDMIATQDEDLERYIESQGEKKELSSEQLSYYRCDLDEHYRAMIEMALEKGQVVHGRLVNDPQLKRFPQLGLRVKELYLCLAKTGERKDDLPVVTVKYMLTGRFEEHGPIEEDDDNPV